MSAVAHTVFTCGKAEIRGKLELELELELAG